MIYKVVISIISVACLLSSAPITYFSHFDYKYINLRLDSYNNTEYIFNKQSPFFIPDYSYNGVIIDGSMDLPLGLSIPNHCFINNNDVDKQYSQLSLIQDKQSKFYDTNIFYKYSNADRALDIYGVVESKSINTNINQNYFLELNSQYLDNIVKISYLYHFEDVPIYNAVGQHYYNRKHELFNGGILIKNMLSKLWYDIQFNFQFSESLKFQDEPFLFNNKIYWVNSKFLYSLNDRIKLSSEVKCKMNNGESNGEELFDVNYNYFSIGSKVEILNDLDFSIDILNINKGNKNSVDFNYNLIYNFNSLDFSVRRAIDLYMDLEDDYDMGIVDLVIDEISIKYHKDSYDFEFDIGQGSTESIEYNYVNHVMAIIKNNFSLNCNIGYFNGDNLYFNKFASYSVIASPFDFKQYRPYVKVFGDYVSINSNALITNNAVIFPRIAPINNIQNLNTDIYNNFSLINGEIGLIFDAMKISLVKNLDPNQNVFNYFNADDLAVQPYDYFVSVVWMFED